MDLLGVIGSFEALRGQGLLSMLALSFSSRSIALSGCPTVQLAFRKEHF